MVSNFTMTETVAFVSEVCCECGVVFAMTTDLQRSRKRTKDTFYCPNGHGQHYLAKTDAEKLREANEALRKLELRLQAEVDQRNAAERERQRQAQRSRGGACPCCNRTFVQLARHMKSRHPDYASAPSGGP